MRRCAALILSAALHTALIVTLSLAWKEAPAAQQMVMRVTLNSPQEVTPVAAVQTEQAAEKIIPPVPPKVTKKVTQEKKEIKPKKTIKPTPDKTQPPKKPTEPQPEADTSPSDFFPADTVFDAEEAAVSNGAYNPDAALMAPVGPSALTRTIHDASTLKVTKKVTPDYPMISRKRREGGTVVLLIEISSGRVGSVEVERSSGHSPLDESAVKAVKGWVFDAGHGGAILARIPFKFDIR
jgi:protein TonB